VSHAPGRRCSAARADCLRSVQKQVPVVVAPTTIEDARGRFVDGLTAEQLMLHDDNVPQRVQLDWTIYPIDLVVALQTSSNSLPVIDKLGGSGILFTRTSGRGCRTNCTHLV
jgi:hypothetical protein